MIKLNYRPEIDGLRAIAVLGVIIYHVEIFLNGKKLFTGGFLGVDIFFVISGYLITSLIIKEFLFSNSFSLKNFYFRRAKRILPALLFMISVSIFFAWNYLTPKNFLEYSNSIISSIFFYSNYFFYFQDLIYNSEDSLLKPLLHTWSLAVEEQFYIFFPLALILFFKYIKNNLIYFFLVLLIIFFFLSNYLTFSNSSFSFYSNFSRFWEILSGSLLAILEIQKKKIHFKYENLLPSIGFFLIFFSYISFDKYTLHPSYFTIFPILGVFLIIHYINSEQFIFKILTLKVFSKIGLWSYSLYLWHYPIFAFARNRGKELSDFDKLELILLTFIISVLSYYLVEQPFRKIEFKKIYKYLFLITILTTSLLAFSFLSIKNNGFDDRIHVFLKNQARENLWEKAADENGICFNRVDNFCNFNKNGDKSVILIGDSQTGVLSYSLSSKLKKSKYNFLSINREACIYLPNFEKRYLKDNKEYKNCTIESKNKIDKLIFSKNESIIVIGGHFKYHFSPKIKWNYISKNNLDVTKSFKNSLIELFENNKVILIYPIPSSKFDITKKIMNEVPKNTFNATEYLNKNPFTNNYEYYLDENRSVLDLFNSIEHENLYKIFPDNIFCDKKNKKQCFTHKGKDIFYTDKHHLSAIGAEKLSTEIFDMILKIK